MTQAVALCSLAVLDAALAGFRSMAGRDAHLTSRALISHWMIRGAVAGIAALAIVGALLGTLLATSTEPDTRYQDMLDAGTRMLMIFVPYATVVLIALAGYAIPVLDIRCLATTVVLGPLTLARPAVILVGAIAAAWTAPAPVQLAAFTTVAIILAVEACLHIPARRTPPGGVQPAR